ncbi:Methylthioribose-1-phosphate isomerase [Orchesella cincta]|uniref:Methylthioribose-1-phosphate isomerase n=1 Tax=Orchesella cincta TaxID=48709 RepID=A0A1D2MVC8_ORCCI|nr:Methylthioribose-1-phosphate isomerase [Orchesella cincta]
MASDSGLLQSIKYTRGQQFQVLDQLRVPQEHVYRDIKTVADGVEAISTMQVGCLSIVADMDGKGFTSAKDFLLYIEIQVKALIDARPTAVNMKREGIRLINFVKQQITQTEDVAELKTRVVNWIEELVKTDLETNKAIGKHGAEDIIQRAKTEGSVNVLTHCNTGSLATSGYGTALGVVRSLFQNGKLEHAFFTETRPYNQGSRLTAFELKYDKIPSTLVCDSAVSWLMKTRKIAAVIVGADRVARNGDTANKVGTYQLALAAKFHGVNFYVAAPFSTIDGNTASGENIVIEERPSTEVTHIAGKPISPEGINVWNPAFDVTPASLITGIVTENGVIAPEDLSKRIDEYNAANI